MVVRTNDNSSFGGGGREGLGGNVGEKEWPRLS